MTNQRQPRYSKGQRINGRFLVHQALIGGMGEVYLCLDEEDLLPRALKTFQGNSPQLRDAFHDEIVKWIRLDRHPSIVQCHWARIFNDGLLYAGMDWIASESGKTDLRSWLRNGPLALEQTLLFTIDIVRGLIHANEKVPGIVHRDLKPENVLVNQARQAKINDFGLALVAQRAGSTIQGDEGNPQHIMRVGNVVGTPHYMAPEQWRGEHDIDFRTDVYAVGCIIYELLTGKTVYHGRTIGDLRIQHMESPVPILLSEFPPEVRHILDGCLAKLHTDRYDQLETLLDDLRGIYETSTGKGLWEIAAEEFTAADLESRAATYMFLGRHELAIKDLNELLTLNPNNVGAYLSRGKHYLELGQNELAFADFDEAVRLNPNDPNVFATRGTGHVQLERDELAFADFDQAIRLDPNDHISYLMRGQRHKSLGQHKQAIADFNEVIRLHPESICYIQRGGSLSALGEYEAAIADYTVAIDRISAIPNRNGIVLHLLIDAHLNRGNRYGDLGQHERAICDYDRVIELNPKYAVAYINRGIRYRDLRQHERAIRDYDRAIELDPNHAAAYRNRAASYASLGQHERAIRDYDRAIEINPNYVAAYRNRATSYVSLGQHESAIRDYDRVIQFDPNDAATYVSRGNYNADKGQHERALADYNEAIRLKPTYALAYTCRGTVYDDMGQHQRAIRDYDAAIALDPNDAATYNNRGNSYGALGQHERAIEDYDAAIRLNPSFALAYYLRGVLLANNAHSKEALLSLERAYALGFQQAAGKIQELRQRLGLPPGQVQANANDPQAAFDAFQKTGSFDAMRHTVGQFPILKNMIPAIEQVILEKIPPEHRPAFEQRLAWLQRSMEGQ